MSLRKLIRKLFTYKLFTEIRGVQYLIVEEEVHVYMVSSRYHRYTIRWDEAVEKFTCDHFIQERVFEELTDFIDDYF